MKRQNLIFLIILLLNFLYLLSLDYTIPPNTCSIQSGDFNGDGDNDIVVSHNYQWGCISFLENTGNGEFILIDTINSFGSIVIYSLANLDNQAGLEIITNYQEGFEGTKQILMFFNYLLDDPFYYNTEEFAPIGKFNPGDLTGDGDYDLVFSSSGINYENRWGIIYNYGFQNFSDINWYDCPNQADNAEFHKFACYDLDDNGRDDIIAYTNPETYIYYNYFDHFVLDSLDCYAPNGNMVSEDFDNDNDFDIIVTHWPGGLQSHFLIYENIGNHEFILHDVIYQYSWGEPYEADVNCDGLIDIVNVGGIFRSYLNQGEMDFSVIVEQDYPDYGESWVIATFSDFDGNGTDDIAIIRYGIDENNLSIYFNNGNGNFEEEPQTEINNEELIINNYKLNNYPNPFNQTTTINYILPVNIEKAIIEIFNVKGERVNQLRIKNYELGINELIWDGTDNYRKKVSSGIYLYQIKMDEYVSKMKKMILMKN